MLANPAIAAKASGLSGTMRAEQPEDGSRLPATLVRIPAEQREKTGE